jgi:excisionase family DNA binding protein
MLINACPGEVTAKEAALLLGVSLVTVYRLYHAGYISARRPSRFCIWFSRASVLAHRRATEEDPQFWARKAALPRVSVRRW